MLVKTVFTVCAVVVAVLALLWFVWHVPLAIALTLASVLIATALDHGVRWLGRHRVRRGVGIALVTVTLLAAVAAVLLVLLPPAVSQVQSLVEEAPELAARLRGSTFYDAVNRRVDLEAQLETLRRSAAGKWRGALDSVLRAVGAILSALGASVTVLFLTVFMLAFGPRLVRAALAEATPARKPRYERVLAKIHDSLGGYLTGLGLICLANATATTLFLAIVGVPFFLPLGILSGLSSLVPLAGATVAGVVITIIALLAGGGWQALATAVFFIVYQQLENQLLGPLVYRRTVDVNPLLSLLAVIFFAELAGIFGAILAVPALATGQIVLREVLRFRREQRAQPGSALAVAAADVNQPPVEPPRESEDTRVH